MNKLNLNLCRIQSSGKRFLRWFFHLSHPGPRLFSLQGNIIDNRHVDDGDKDDDDNCDKEDDDDDNGDEDNKDDDDDRSEMTLKTAVGTPMLNRSRETKIG